MSDELTATTLTPQQQQDLLLAQTVRNNTDDIGKLKEAVARIDELSKSTAGTASRLESAVSQIELKHEKMESKMEANLKEIKHEIQRSNDRIYQSQIDNLRQYKTTVWTVGGSITGSIVVGIVLFVIKL